MRARAILLLLCLGCSGPADVAVLRAGETSVVFGPRVILGVQGGDNEIEIVFAYSNDGTKLDIAAHGSTILLGEGPFCELKGLGLDLLGGARTSTGSAVQDCSTPPVLSCVVRCPAVSTPWELLSK